MDIASELSSAARTVWGKSGDQVQPLPLWRHLADAAEVAGSLWDEWLPMAVRQRIADEMPLGAADGRVLVQWLAGVHDIGKATPAFAWQVPSLRERMRYQGFRFDSQVEADRRRAPHATAGFVVLTDWLVHRYGWHRSAAIPLAVVVGGHHGVPPTDSEIQGVLDAPYLVGVESPWPQVRAELLEWMTVRLGAQGRLEAWRDVILSPPVQALLTGIVIVADWIASNEEYFPYQPVFLNGSDRLAAAWEALDLPSPWSAVSPPADADVLYATRFELPEGARPRPVQRAVVDAARQMPVPGLLIVEAPMGEGKTEAALAAVEVLAERSGAGGCFIALPTRATSDAMFSRVLGWLRRLPDADIGRGAHGVALAHGKARLNTEFTTLFRAPLPSGIGMDEGGASAAAHRWLAGRKRAMLAGFVIGTIDQLLFTALKKRHLVLRHLGLAGKVVVIDEAHAYDVYMSQYLDRALEWLGAYGVPVVVLSATLPARRRAEMLQAYDNGRFGSEPRPRRRRRTGSGEPSPYQALQEDMRYPLLSFSGVGRAPTAVACDSSSRTARVTVERHGDDLVLLAETLREALAEGGCALVVRNTVTRVQETADELRRQFGDELEVSVAHSRFMGPDRSAKDRWLVDAFGSPEHLARLGRQRPGRHVVVASQVAEQSLDIDFDVLVTDLAPVDLILQRIGRLHRHRRNRPAPLSQPRCLITGADWDAQPPAPVSGSRAVYGESNLLRAAAVLWPYLAEDRVLELPADISSLVQAAYGGGPVGPGQWQARLQEAAERAEKKESKRTQRANDYRLGKVGAAGSDLRGWLAGETGDAERGSDDARGRAHVRDDGPETLDVLVLVRTGEGLRTPSWLAENGGAFVPTDVIPPAWLARTVASCTLSLPAAMTSGPGQMDRLIDELERRAYYPAWKDNPWLGGELILELDEAGTANIAGFSLAYDRFDGLRVARDPS
ncbi:CRISPR-associated helicase Cas3' [Actinoplanes teichomyceticus]|uniref:CRISPR-associated helicase Cas3' n=1 Tax=Actinoplanes teichomyceticus TaxID=1867 RepID=UPI0013DD9C29|nr:CRISPR-associated helicase Cas3' [Actinoplanes teichomyceticus]